MRRVRRLRKKRRFGYALGAGEVGGSGGRVERRGAAAGHLQVAGRRLAELILEIEEAAGVGHLQGRAVVVGEDLGEVLGAAGGALLEPACQSGVLGGAVGAGELLVGDVADEGVHEEELGLAFHRGAAHRGDELLGDQFHEAR